MNALITRLRLCAKQAGKTSMVLEGTLLEAATALEALPLAAPKGITIDFKQASELLEMFGGEPTEMTLLFGEGHSGRGLYASYTDMPEEGAEFLGVSDDGAVPAPQPPAQP